MARIKPWHTSEGPEQQFWRCFAEGLNQKFNYVVCGKGYKEHRKCWSWALVPTLQSFS